MMGSNRTSLFLLFCCSLFCSIIHLHFPHLIHSCPFCFHSFSSLSFLLPFLFLHPHHLLPSSCPVQCILPPQVEKYLENPQGGSQDGSSRKWGCRNKEETLTHEMVQHCQQEGEEVVKRERMCMLKMHSWELWAIPLVWGPFPPVGNWDHSSCVGALMPLSLEIINRRNIITSNAKLHQEARN